MTHLWYSYHAESLARRNLRELGGRALSVNSAVKLKVDQLEAISQLHASQQFPFSRAPPWLPKVKESRLHGYNTDSWGFCSPTDSLFFSYALEARSSTDSEFGWEGVEMLRFEDKREGTKKSSTRIEGWKDQGDVFWKPGSVKSPLDGKNSKLDSSAWLWVFLHPHSAAWGKAQNRESLIKTVLKFSWMSKRKWKRGKEVGGVCK